MSLMRNKGCESKTMKNREKVIVKTPDLLEASGPYLNDSNIRDSSQTISDTESSLLDSTTDNTSLNDLTKDNTSYFDSAKDNVSLEDSTKGNDSDRYHDSSDDSTDKSKDHKERSRLKLLKERKSALDELLTTEQNYIVDLEQIVEGYMKLIRNNDIPKPPTLAGKELMVFGNLQQIYEWHKNTFEPEMAKYIDNPQKLATIFTRFEKRFYMYVKYCENKPKSEDITYENLDYFEQLREILDHKLQLADMLIKPVQRLMKYELLLKAIMKYTEKAGEDIMNIQRAIEVMCIIPRAANDMMNVGRLQGFDGKVTAQGRLLLHDSIEICEQNCKNTLERVAFKVRRAFLFEQIIIFSKTIDKRKNATSGTGLHYLFSGSIRVNKMILNEMVDNPLNFRLVDKSPASSVHYLCQCKTESVKKNWITQIKILLDNQTDFLKALQSPISYQRECNRINSGDVAPVIESDQNDSSSKKPPNSKNKKNKNCRSFRNLFIKQTTNLDPSTAKLRTDKSPAPSSSRKFSLTILEAFSILKTPDVEKCGSKWPKFPSLSRRKNSDVSSISPILTDNSDLLTTSGDLHKHLSASNEYIWIDKSSDSECDDGRISKLPPKTAGIPIRIRNLFMETPRKTRDDKVQTTIKEDTIRFAKQLENTSAFEGSLVTLVCHLSTNSNHYSVSWIGPDDDVIVGGNDVTIGDDNGVLTLMLSKVSIKDSGIYKCLLSCNNECVVTSCQLKVLPEILPKPKRKIILSHNHDSSTFKNDDISCNEGKQTAVIEHLLWDKGFEEKYELQGIIENGKFSTYQECIERLSKKKYVAKFYEKSMTTKEFVSMEANNSCSPIHPCIVGTVKLFESRESYVMILPSIHHRCKLLNYINNLYSFDEFQATNLICQLFTGLSQIHTKNILYLDVKPENFDIDLAVPTSPILKFTDFSFSRKFDTNHPYIHPFTGDYEFTSPEIIHSTPLTFTSDVWNAAVLFYTLLSGTTPFHNEDQEIMRRKIVTISYDFPKSLFSNINPSLTTFISSILVMPPSQRPTSHLCMDKCNYLKTISKRTHINKRLFIDFIKRRQTLQI